MNVPEQTNTGETGQATSSSEDHAAGQPSSAEALQAEIERLKAELQQQRRQAEENLAGWQRAQADFANFRKRTEQERSEAVKYAEARLLADLLPVLDDLDRAWQTLPAELRALTWIDGISLIDRKLRGTLAAHGLEPIEALGKEFDPYLHEAIMREEGEAGELATVVAELQRGYKLRDRVLRPTLVKVGKKKQQAEPPSDQSPEQNQAS